MIVWSYSSDPTMSGIDRTLLELDYFDNDELVNFQHLDTYMVFAFRHSCERRNSEREDRDGCRFPPV
jgi:hypothetical protein